MKKYIVRLTPEEQAQLLQRIGSSKVAARTLLQARILWKADNCREAAGWSEEAITEAPEVHTTTVVRACISALWKKVWKRPGGPSSAGATTSAN